MVAGMESAVTLGYTICNVADVRSTLDFYMAAFGFAEKMCTPENDYGELATGTTTLAFVSNSLAESNLAAAGGFSPLDSAGPPPAVSITLVTTTLEATVQAAIDAGASMYVEPIHKPWGQTVAYVRDPNGALVEIATPIAS